MISDMISGFIWYHMWLCHCYIIYYDIWYDINDIITSELTSPMISYGTKVQIPDAQPYSTTWTAWVAVSANLICFMENQYRNGKCKSEDSTGSTLMYLQGSWWLLLECKHGAISGLAITSSCQEVCSSESLFRFQKEHSFILSLLILALLNFYWGSMVVSEPEFSLKLTWFFPKQL